MFDFLPTNLFCLSLSPLFSPSLFYFYLLWYNISKAPLRSDIFWNITIPARYRWLYTWFGSCVKKIQKKFLYKRPLFILADNGDFHADPLALEPSTKSIHIHQDKQTVNKKHLFFTTSTINSVSRIPTHYFLKETLSVLLFWGPWDYESSNFKI